MVIQPNTTTIVQPEACQGEKDARGAPFPGFGIDGAGAEPDDTSSTLLSSASSTARSGGKQLHQHRRGRTTTASQIGRAHARFWQDEFHPARAFPIAAERGYDGADLLVAGQHQKRWGASITFHAHDKDIG